MYEARGWIYREQCGNQPSAYRDGGTSEESMRPAPAPAFKLPADAALLWALLPDGLGDEHSHDGEGPFSGFELCLQPWMRNSHFYAR
jgi:hypothetical protein